MKTFTTLAANAAPYRQAAISKRRRTKGLDSAVAMVDYTNSPDASGDVEEKGGIPSRNAGEGASGVGLRPSNSNLSPGARR